MKNFLDNQKKKNKAKISSKNSNSKYLKRNKVKKTVKANPKNNIKKLKISKKKRNKKSLKGGGLFDLFKVKEYKQHLDDQKKGIFKSNDNYYKEKPNLSISKIDSKSKDYKGGMSSLLGAAGIGPGNDDNNDNIYTFMDKYKYNDINQFVKIIIDKQNSDKSSEKYYFYKYNPSIINDTDSNIKKNISELQFENDISYCILENSGRQVSNTSDFYNSLIQILFYNSLSSELINQLIKKNVLANSLTYKGKIYNISFQIYKENNSNIEESKVGDPGSNDGVPSGAEASSEAGAEASSEAGAEASPEDGSEVKSYKEENKHQSTMDLLGFNGTRGILIDCKELYGEIKYNLYYLIDEPSLNEKGKELLSQLNYNPINISGNKVYILIDHVDIKKDEQDINKIKTLSNTMNTTYHIFDSKEIFDFKELEEVSAPASEGVKSPETGVVTESASASKLEGAPAGPPVGEPAGEPVGKPAPDGVPASAPAPAPAPAPATEPAPVPAPAGDTPAELGELPGGEPVVSSVQGQPLSESAASTLSASRASPESELTKVQTGEQVPAAVLKNPYEFKK